MSNNSVEEGSSESTPREEQVQEVDQIMTMVLNEKDITFLDPPKTNDATVNLNEDETRRRKINLSIPGAFRVSGIDILDQNNQEAAADEEFTISSGSDDSASAIYVVPRAALVDEEQKNPRTAAPDVGFQDEFPLAHASAGTKEKTLLVKNRWVLCLAVVCCLMIAGLAAGLTVAMMGGNSSSAVVGAEDSVLTTPAPSPRPLGNKEPRLPPKNDDRNDTPSPSPSPNSDGGGSGGSGAGGGSGGGGSGGGGGGGRGGGGDG
jgi:hypothetical protein